MGVHKKVSILSGIGLALSLLSFAFCLTYAVSVYGDFLDTGTDNEENTDPLSSKNFLYLIITASSYVLSIIMNYVTGIYAVAKNKKFADKKFGRSTLVKYILSIFTGYPGMAINAFVMVSSYEDKKKKREMKKNGTWSEDGTVVELEAAQDTGGTNTGDGVDTAPVAPIGTSFMPTEQQSQPSQFNSTYSKQQPQPSQFNSTYSEQQPQPNQFTSTYSEQKSQPSQFTSTYSEQQPQSNQFNSTYSEQPIQEQPSQFNSTYSEQPIQEQPSTYYEYPYLTQY